MGLPFLQDKAVFAFLDDTYIVAAPDRVRTLYDALASALWDRARIRLHQGKTRIWNAAGEEPPDIADLGEGEESVWVGDWTLPPESQGLTALGSPLGHDAFVARQLRHKRDDHDRLLASIPAVDDLQAAWLLLRFCAAPRANYLLRTLPPHLTADFAAEHDAAVARCLATLLEQGDTPLPPTSLNTAQLAQRFGGLGLRSAWQDRFAAHWASWCDTLPVILARAPAAAARLRAALQGDGALPSTAAATHARAHLCDLGFEAPDWADLCSGAATAPPDPDHADDPWPVKGWQRSAARACDKRAYETHLSDLTPASRALLLSQAGPFASRALNLMPTRDDIAIPSAQFRVPLPRSTGPPRRPPHGLRHLRRPRHTLADMNLDVPVADERRIEVVANGLPLWHGSQLALDATIVSPLTRRGEAHPRADVQPGCAVAAAARRKRCQTYPELGRARRCRLVVVGIETGGRFGTEAVQLLRLLARHRADSVPAHLRPAAITSWVARWSGLLAVAAQRAYAATLLELPPAAELGEGPMPDLHEVAIVTVSRCLHAEAETFVGWLPVRISAGFAVPGSKPKGIEGGRRGRTRRLQWSRGSQDLKVRDKAKMRRLTRICICATRSHQQFLPVCCRSRRGAVRGKPLYRGEMFQCRMCSENPFNAMFAGSGKPDKEKEKKKKEKRKSTSRRDAAAFQARSEEEVVAAVKTWSQYAHPRANDFFSSPEQLEDVLRQLAKGIDKNDDPILGSEERCVYWYGDVTKEDLQAAIRMVKPGESAESVTYVNRVLAFIFATDESFDKLMKLPKEPFKMSCGDQRTNRLGGMAGSRLSDLSCAYIWRIFPWPRPAECHAPRSTCSTLRQPHGVIVRDCDLLAQGNCPCLQLRELVVPRPVLHLQTSYDLFMAGDCMSQSGRDALGSNVESPTGREVATPGGKASPRSAASSAGSGAGLFDYDEELRAAGMEKAPGQRSGAEAFWAMPW
ncbi:hypothetical protein AK812_SmicGene7597 [Symbiodinium microadriaticum]|uniref:Reverse transcriptase domain-containing protein n=1 Tax=Symbiodinium microadriaticum TaxID=2951 RepID=A0A1Q9EN37_SYMMI|nr:hypothetical protein AK812_SmicGene7597 [Symbiodinium microadriaticum]